MLAVLSLALLLAGAEKGSIPWRADASQALADAEAKGQPLLLQFRTKCAEQKAECDRMQAEVWADREVAAAAQRFVPVLAGEEPPKVQFNLPPVQYNVGSLQYTVEKPTTVLADPWGNEIVKLAGPVPRERMLGLLQAVPKDFTALRGTGVTLRESSQHFGALLSAASFYESQGLREFAEEYYRRADASPDRQADVVKRRLAAVSRGMNLMQMGKHAEAADLFESTLKKAPNAPLADALLLGQVMAESKRGRKQEAERAFAELKQRFPDSPYLAKAREQLP